MPPATLVSTDSRLWLEYRSSNGQGKGFSAQYEGTNIYIIPVQCIVKIRMKRDSSVFILYINPRRKLIITKVFLWGAKF